MKHEEWMLLLLVTWYPSKQNYSSKEVTRASLIAYE